jgi:WD40 repeat protein
LYKKIALFLLSFLFCGVFPLNAQQTLSGALENLQKGIEGLHVLPGNIHFTRFLDKGIEGIKHIIEEIKPQPPLPEIDFQGIESRIKGLTHSENSEHKIIAEKILESLKSYYRENTSIEIRLVLEKATIIVEEIEPVVFLDEKEAGRGIFLEIAPVAEGERIIRITAEGYAEHRERITVKSGQKHELNVRLDAVRGKIKITSAPEGASIYLDEEEKARGITPFFVNDLITSRLAGAYSFRVEKPGFVPKTQKINAPGEFHFVLSEAPGVLNLITTPENIHFFLNDVGPLTKNQNPHKEELEPGNYILVVKTEGYKDYKESIEIKAGVTSYYTISLTPEKGTLLINSNPDKAIVYLNGIERGLTPLKIEELPVSKAESIGKYNVRIAKEDYYEKEITVSVESGIINEMRVELLPKPGNVKLKTTPEYAYVEFGEKKEVAKGEILFTEVEAGQQLFRIYSPGYKSTEKLITVLPNRTVEHNIVLEPLTEIIKIQSNPSEATIYIGGKDRGKTPFEENLALSVVAGKYNIKITKEGYETIEDVVEIVQNKPELLEYNLLRLPPTGKEVWRKDFNGEIRSIKSWPISSEVEGFVAGLNTGRLLFLDREGNILRNINAHSRSIYALRISPSKEHVVTAGADNTLKAWDVSGRSLWTIPSITHPFLSVAYYPEGDKLLAGFRNGVIRVIDANQGSLGPEFLESHNDRIWALAVSPCGKLALSGSADNSVILWDLSLNRKNFIWREHNATVQAVDFSNDGRFCLSAGDDGRINIREVSSGKSLLSVQPVREKITAAIFSPDNRFVIAGSETGVILVVELTSGKVLNSFNVHNGRIYGLTYTKDGRYLLSGSEDKTIVLLD